MAQGLSRKILWLALLLGLFNAGNVLAGPILKSTHFPADIYEGRAMRLKLVFEWPADEGDFEVQSPEIINLSNMRLLGFSQSAKASSSNSGSVVRLTLVYEFLPLKTGSGMVGRFDILYRHPGQSVWRRIPIPPLTLDIRPPLPHKTITILILMLAALLVPILLWSVYSLGAEWVRKKNFKIDPKQELYKNALQIFRDPVTGSSQDYLQTLFSKWSDELLKVVMTHYNMPLRSASPAEILKDLGNQAAPADEIREIKILFDSLKQLNASAWSMTTDKLETAQLAFATYARNKLTTENRAFQNF